MDQNKMNESQPLLNDSQEVNFTNKTENSILIRYIRIFLLVVIIIGLGLLVTQKIWVSKLVSVIVGGDVPHLVESVPASSQTDSQYSALEQTSGNAGVVDGDLKLCKKIENTLPKLVCYQDANVSGYSVGANLVVFDPMSRVRNTILTGGFYGMGLMGSGGGKFYPFTTPYEANGPGEIYQTDLESSRSTKVGLNVYGLVSPDFNYYTTNGEITGKDGQKYCNAQGLNASTLPASAIKVLNFSTGEVKTILEDKTKVFLPKGWTDDSSTVIYSSYEVNGVDVDGCPELVNEKEIKIKI